MRKLMLAALAVTISIPSLAAPAAAAESTVQRHHNGHGDHRSSRHDRRQDRRATRQVHRQDRRATRQVHRQDRRATRQVHRQDRRAYRQYNHRTHRDVQRYSRNHRWGQNAWRDHRRDNRRLYSRGNWRAPFRYHRFTRGMRLNHIYFGSRYYISNPWMYRLPAVSGFYRYVRHYNDVLLIDIRTGYVIRVYRNFFW